MKKIIIFFATMVSCISLNAQTLTLEECRQMALENNLKISSAFEQLTQAEYTAKAMRANFLPNISARASFLMSNAVLSESIDGGYLPTYITDATTGELTPNIMLSDGTPVLGSDGSYIFNQYAYFPGIDLELEVNSLFSSSLQLEQPIYMGGKVASGYKMSKLGVELAGLNKRLTEDQVILECDQAYWNCLRAGAMVEALEIYKQTVESFLRDIENAVEVGMKTSNDMLKVKVSLNEAELNLMRATNAERLSKMNLCHVVGLDLNQNIELVEPMLVKSQVKYEDYDISQRVEYQMLSKQIDLSEQNERVLRADFLPNIAAVGMMSYSNGMKLNGDKFLNDTSLGAMVSVSIPIFHWGEGRNKIKAERHKSTMLKLERDQAAQQMTLEINQAYNALLEAQLEARFVVESEAQALENVRVTKNAYDAGKETISNFLEAQTLWQKSLTDAVDAQANLRIAHTKYLKAVGRLSEK